MPDISERSFEETIEAGLVAPGSREGVSACWTDALGAEDAETYIATRWGRDQA